MGSACAGHERESASRLRLHVIEHEKAQLKQQLIESENQNAVLHEQSQNDIMTNFLRGQNKEMKQKLEGSEKERRRLLKDVQKKNERINRYKNEVDLLRTENEALRQKLAVATIEDAAAGNESHEYKSSEQQQVTVRTFCQRIRFG